MSESKVIVLDTNTANQIAAGEVVENPASVVKELLENALDAGAKNIEVEIAEGGIKYIRVTDDGSGMNEEDARLSVLRHATSKIRTNEDLLSINTLGFRGEALPSIASVSRFTLLTRMPENDLATRVSLVGGEQEEIMQTGASIGTSVIVEDLFFNVPARRKFLRLPNTECRYINEIVGKLALARPDIKFVLVNNGRQVVNTPGNADLGDTVGNLYGGKTQEELLPVRHESDLVRVSGYIGKPSLLKSSRQWQTIIVNGRVISSRFVSRALDHAYQSQLPKSGYPFAVIKLEIDTHQIDVNVHPQKSEIRFSDEQSVYRLMYRAITDALLLPMKEMEQRVEPVAMQNNVLMSGQTTPVSRPAPPYQPQIWRQPEMVRESVTSYASTEQREKPSVDFSQVRASIAQEEIYPAQATEETPTDNQPAFWPLGQIDATYIIAQSEDCLYLIDQHAAHERIVYDRLVSNKKVIPEQQLLLPVFVELSADDVDLALAYKEQFAELCFDIEAAGSELLRLNTIPADIDSQDLDKFIREALRLIMEMKKPSAAELRHELIAMTACKAAIKANQILNMRQMRELIADLLQTEHPFTCCHGRPTILSFSSQELARMFKRT